MSETWALFVLSLRCTKEVGDSLERIFRCPQAQLSPQAGGDCGSS